MVLGMFKGKKGKTAKKKPVKKVARKRKTVKKAKPKKEISESQLIGKVTHYFPHVKAGVIKVSTGEVNVGDTLYIKGHTTDFKQKVTSMQINHVPVEKAKKGDEIGILVKKRVRGGDSVYKV